MFLEMNSWSRWQTGTILFMPPIILVTVTGHDKPGLTAGLLGVLAAADAAVIDMEQVVLQENLTLALAITVPDDTSIQKDLLYYGFETGMAVDLEVVHETKELDASKKRFVVTVLGQEMRAEALQGVTEVIAEAGGNIDRIVRLASYPVIAYEFEVIGGGQGQLRRGLMEGSSHFGLDVAVQPLKLERRAKRLVVLDVDSTLIQNEVIDLVADEAGCGSEVTAITEAAMAGEIDFAESLSKRIACFEGQDEAILERVASRMVLTPGARTFVQTLKRLGYKVAAVSGGFTFFTEKVKRRLELDHAYANTLEVIDGKLTGRVIGGIVDGPAKAAILRDIADAESIPLEQVVAVGDGANDLDMLGAAGLGIAFNAKSLVQDAADAAVNVPYLDAILFMLGIRRSEVEESQKVPARK